MLQSFTFQKAQPIWLQGLSTEKNITMSAVTQVSRGAAVLCVAASCVYVVMVNGRFAAYGPARCAHGCYYVDELDLTDYLTGTVNVVAIRTAGYNVNSFAYLDQPSFLCAELTQNGKLVAATDTVGGGFHCYRVAERLQKVPRYSFQRPFVEAYRLTEGAFAYETEERAVLPAVVETVEGAKQFFKRIVPYGLYPDAPWQVLSGGLVNVSEKAAYYTDRSIENIGDQLKGFCQQDLEYLPHVEVGQLDFLPGGVPENDSNVLYLEENSYVVLRFERDYAGILSFDLECSGDGTLYALFDEVADSTGMPNPFRSHETCNVITWQCEPGCYRVQCAEPYTMQYLCIAAGGMAAELKNLTLHRVEFPMQKLHKVYHGTDRELEAIQQAALCSFASNVVDIYMDCPSRERAGWLCDSYFMGRVEKLLTGESAVERSFLTNYILPKEFAYLPQGMVPMCYPADFYNGEFIPSWALWFILELKEYQARSGDAALLAAAQKRVYGILDYFKPFENELGLLEQLEGWVFVEWSRANDLVQDVNFPVNMLYAAAKEAAGQLYDDAALLQSAKALHEQIRQLAQTDNGFFCDNAIRRNGHLELSGECTEVCQYYAFYFGVATQATHSDLLNTLFTAFGPARKMHNDYPSVHFANSFIGNYLRLDLLSRYGRYEQLLHEIKEYFTYMAEETGTLWEHDASTHSCNHGFASYVLVWMAAADKQKEKKEYV